MIHYGMVAAGKAEAVETLVLLRLYRTAGVAGIAAVAAYEARYAVGIDTERCAAERDAFAWSCLSGDGDVLVGAGEAAFQGDIS